MVDIKGDWWGIRTSADGGGPGLPFVIFGGDHGDVPLEPSAGELLANLVVDERVPAVLDLSAMSKTKARSFATAFVEQLYARNRDPLHVVIEEADVLIPQRASAETARLLGAMEDLAKRGRSRGLGLTICSQRPQEVSKSVLDLMETVVLLRITGPRSIKAVREWISVNTDVDDATTEVIASLPSLQTGEAWVWSPAFLRLLQRVRVTQFSTFDSHVTPRPGVARVTPRGRADIDLAKLGEEIAATAERARDNDPSRLRGQVAETHRSLESAHRQLRQAAAEITARDERIAELQQRLQDLQDLQSRPDPAPAIRALASVQTAIQSVIADLSHADPETDDTPRTRSLPPPQPAAPAPAGAPIKTGPAPQPPEPHRFRSGAQRMIESLARMAPLRLTKAQWGMVSGLKHTSGTFGTYLGELRRAGLVEDNAAGFTVTAAGFNHLGHQPEPMTGQELQQHYLSILRAGNARMLAAIIDAYPAGLTRQDLAEAVEMSVSSGTYGTYLGILRRNALIDERNGTVVASDILIHGANSALTTQ